jgi:hypothetical protein
MAGHTVMRARAQQLTDPKKMTATATKCNSNARGLMSSNRDRALQLHFDHRKPN